jgi:hypothetical protein
VREGHERRSFRPERHAGKPRHPARPVLLDPMLPIEVQEVDLATERVEASGASPPATRSASRRVC